MTKRKKKQKHNVNEAMRIRITDILEKFRQSTDEVYTFDAELSNVERAEVHIVCRKMGMKSKSSGRGSQRRVSVYKTKKKTDLTKENEDLQYVTFSEESKLVLQDLFVHYPPDDGELGEKVFGKHSGKRLRTGPRRDDMFSKPLMSQDDIKRKLESLDSRIKKTRDLQQISVKRSKLPIASYRDIITNTIESHQVVLISGETGCGKTTQVPQFLLEYMWGKGEACKIVCAQPRRISATSVSERISFERGESVGNDIGYKIRLETKGGRHSSIVFCTNGILLRVLVSRGSGRSKSEGSTYSTNEGVSEITHIIVDEVHERDCHSDFILAIIRDVLPTCPHLRLVLMSATLDAGQFSQYFGGCPVITVPGFTYPVRSFYLEDVLSILHLAEDNHISFSSACALNDGLELNEEDKTALDEAISMAWSNDEFETLLDLVSAEGTAKVHNYQHSSSGITPLMVFAAKGRVHDVCVLLSHGADCQLRTKDGKRALELAEQENQQETVDLIKKHMETNLSDSTKQQKLLDKYLATVDPGSIDVVLIEQLLRKICVDSNDGAILVFLPGWEDINKTRERLLASSFFSDPSRFIILSLHSMIPSMEQKKVFKWPSAGCRKIILSTNIAESSITIDDVVYVIDSGRMKEKSYDPYNNVSTLQSSWVSKANARQREGRAGRCQPGICYHLYSKLRAVSMPDFQVPEIKRMPIEELCLQVKMFNRDQKVEDFLKKTLDPPVPEAIHNAITVLQDIGAFSYDEELTELGEKLGYLPVHPVTSKMIFFAILMNCLDPALTIASASDFKAPFTLPMLPSERKKLSVVKSELASLYGGQGDQLAVMGAFECWKEAKVRGQEARFCSQYFVSSNAMIMLDGMRKQLLHELTSYGYISEDLASSNRNARNPGIVHAILVAAFYPMVGRVSPTNNRKGFLIETPGGSKVRLHPHSSISNLPMEKADHPPLLIFDEITRGDGSMFLRNCTVIGPFPLFLHASELAVAPGNEDVDSDDSADDDEGNDDGAVMADKSGRSHEEKVMSSPKNSVMVVVDRWLSFGSTALDVAQIYCLRERLSAAILFKVKHSRLALPPPLAASVNAIAWILSYEGLAGISIPAQPVDSLTSMVRAAEIERAVPERKNNRNSNGFHGPQNRKPAMHRNKNKGVAAGCPAPPASGSMQPPSQKPANGSMSVASTSSRSNVQGSADKMVKRPRGNRSR